MKVNTGEICLTRTVNDQISENALFAKEVTQALSRYIKGDWGETDAEDGALNDRAQSVGDRIVAKYETSVEPIFIITEADQSVTTVLFCNEY